MTDDALCGVQVARVLRQVQWVDVLLRQRMFCCASCFRVTTDDVSRGVQVVREL